MSDINQPAPPQPDTAGADPGENNGTPGNPNVDNNGEPQSPSGDDEMVQVSAKELQELKSKAGRWDKRGDRNRSAKPDRKRSWNQSKAGDGDDQEIPLEVREQLEEANAVKLENFKLKLENKIDRVLNSDEYKDLSPAVKRLLKRNPTAYVDSRSLSALNVDDAIADIQDFLDDELDNLVDQGSKGQQPATTPPTPPASSSRPTSQSKGDDESVEGKTGPARSTTVLKNLMKNKGILK